MTQEGKQLLIKDLCPRLPYGVKVELHDEVCTVLGYFDDFVMLTSNTPLGQQTNIANIKPYLRPMSSMTEDEKEEIAFIRDRDFQSVKKWVHDESIKETGNVCPVTCGEIDYCNEHHLDYRGLIEKGLALEAPEGMYETE